MKNITLALHNVSKTFHQNSDSITILHNSSYTFKPRTSYALMGPSGIGKSTVLHILSGLEKTTHGHVAIGDHQISSIHFHDRVKALQGQVSIIFQNPCLIYELSVLENVMLSALANNTIDDNSITKARQLLDDVGLLDKADHSPNSLSGGQQQRVAIARALYNQPAFLLADEPTGNLDSSTAQTIMTILKMYQEKYGVSLIISTHDANVAKQCDIIVTLRDTALTEV